MLDDTLQGYRVLDLSQYLPGPYATRLLADLGADVVKVEPPAGDYIRQMTWPIIEGVSLMHLHLNRGKKSLVLDLRNPLAVAIYKDLVKTADCVVVGLRWKSRPDRIATLLLGLYREEGEIDYVGSAAVAPARHVEIAARVLPLLENAGKHMLE